MPDHLIGHTHNVNNFQNTNTPDIDLERDVTTVTSAGGFLTEESALNNSKRFRFNLSTIIMSALIFLAILSWFDFMQTTFYTWLQPTTQEGYPTPANKFYYALLATGVVAVLCGLLIIYSEKLQL